MIRFVLILISFPFLVSGQKYPLVYPGDNTLDVTVFEPFEAVYQQAGIEMTVKFVKSEGARPIYTSLMIMPNPTNLSEMSVDMIGHFADDMSFAYRKFLYGRYTSEYIHAIGVNDTLQVSRASIIDNGKTVFSRLPIDQKFIDGTMAFWLLAGLPLDLGYGARFHRWDISETDIGFKETLPFVVAGNKQTIEIEERSFECWPVEVNLENGMILRTYVSKSKPFLIRQEAVQPSGEIIPFVELVDLK